MGLDLNGIWQYEETETAAPVSTMLNRLAGSVSNVVAPISHDTGWVNVPIALPSPWTGSLKARKVGNLVSWKGSVVPNSTNWGAVNNSQTLVDPIPANFLPVDSHTYLFSAATANSAQVAFRVSIQSNGLIVGRCNTASYTFGVNIECCYFQS